MSIDKQILLDLLSARLKDDTALWLTRMLVNHDCTRDYVMRSVPTSAVCNTAFQFDKYTSIYRLC